MKHLFFFFALTLIAACNPQKKSAAQQPAVSSATDLVRFEAGGCRGYCPIYKLNIRSDGSMELEGIRFVEQLGKTTAQLTKDELTRLQAEVKSVNLWQYPAQIPTTVADAPPHTVTVFEGGKSHSVTSTAGTPKPILNLENMIRDLAEAHGLHVKQGVDPNAVTSLTGTVLVKLKPGVNAGNFCMQFMEFKIVPQRRVSEDNVWVMGFNPTQLTEAQLIDILKGMEEVLEAQPNKQATERH